MAALTRLGRNGDGETGTGHVFLLYPVVAISDQSLGQFGKDAPVAKFVGRRTAPDAHMFEFVVK